VAGPSAAASDPADADAWLLQLENAGIRPGLARIRALLDALGLGTGSAAPPTVHLAGTNGKTSTTLLCAAMLRRAGFVTGAYVSPHVETFADRIRIDGEPIDAERFAGHAREVRSAVDELDDPPGQFEALTAIALRAFQAQGVDVRVLETGLGGRLDATNAVWSDVQVLTSVGLDHQAWLGDTIEEIALEKLAIVEEGGELVVGPGLSPEVLALAERVTRERGAALVRARAVPAPALRDPGAVGDFQRANLGTALAATRALVCRHGAPAGEVGDADLVAAGEAILPLRGRLHPIGTAPLVLVDAAHNVEAARALAQALPAATGGRPLVLVCAFLDDKDPAGILRVLRDHVGEAIATCTANPRSLTPEEVAEVAREAGLPARTAADPIAALALAREAAGPAGAVLVAGTATLARELSVPGAAGNASRF
jgi:dihydrofolate synthase/folylpolyglutamate synthase